MVKTATLGMVAAGWMPPVGVLEGTFTALLGRLRSIAEETPCTCPGSTMSDLAAKTPAGTRSAERMSDKRNRGKKDLNLITNIN